MAILPRGLCFALTLWLAMSRPSAANRTESSNSAQWWGSEEFSSVQKSADALRRSGDLAGLEVLYARSISRAQQLRHRRAESTYLGALGNTYLLQYRYAEALDAYRHARDIALQDKDWKTAGAIAPGMSSVYLLVGDATAARQAASDGMAAARRLGGHPSYEAQLKLQNARLSAGAPNAEALFLDAIDAARMQRNAGLEAEGWDLLGEEYVHKGDLNRAEVALTEAHRLRVLQHPRDLRLSYWRLGALRLEQHRLQEADRLTALAIQANLHVGSPLSLGVLLHQRGRIRQEQGLQENALRDFEEALHAKERWREVAPPPAQSSLAAADVDTDTIVHAFVESAANRSLSSGDPTWAARAFLAVERNRAASLRQSAGFAEAWRLKLPPSYWKTLARLRASKSVEDSESLHAQLTEMEAGAGLGSSPNKLESFSTQASLTLFQRGLRNSELFLSFYTGHKESYLWAVTRSSLHLYRLPPQRGLEQAVRDFQQAIVRRDSSSALGEQIHSSLFGQLTRQERAQTDWLLSLDGPLFSLPFAALRTESEFLIESHSLQVVPGATMLREVSNPKPLSFFALADPVYNSADERLRPVAWATMPAPQPPDELNRLAASGDEIRRSSKAWRKPDVWLEGSDATLGAFMKAMESVSPRVLHLATHVVTSEQHPGQAFLALSAGADGSPELLGPSEIAMLRAPRALVVMTGCASGSGVSRPGAGLLGLTRAWMVAGASAVLATNWPIEDIRGDLLPEFYRQIPTVSAAEALRRAQAAMIHSDTWQADPAYWAAFHLTGGVR